MSTISPRLPASLHKKLRELARAEDVSINQLVTMAVAEKMSTMMTADYLQERAARGDRAKFDRAMSKVADVEADEHDRLITPGRGIEPPATGGVSTQAS